jgi:HPr kinase/phosphorylase
MSAFKNLQIIKVDKVPISVLLKSPVKLKSLIGDIGINNEITDKNLHRPQLALAGYVGLFTFHRIQVFGNTECFYLRDLNKEDRIKAFKNITQFPIPCIILTNNNELDPDLIEMAKEASIAVLTTEFETTKAFTLLSEYLDDQFAEQATVHASFVDVYGVGILFVGRSAIGKSEIALDLIERGHRLVADDVVVLTKVRETVLMGTGTNLVQHFMEIRGLGIIDVRQMFGIRAIRFQKRLEIIVELEDWHEDNEYTRTGLDDEPTNLMGIDINTIKLPIFPGKNITVIAEVIALNYLLRTYGYNAAEVFTDKLKDLIEIRKSKKFHQERIISYFQGDRE